MDVAVALIVFNRPEPTARVFAAVAAARPARLYVIADGPRAGRPGEAERVAAARAVTDRVDWPCTVRRHYADANLGCRDRVASGLDWLFGHEAAAIILEDDCLPTPAFFGYCAEMLDLYRDDRRVFAASGSNFARRDEAPAHYLSNFPLMWGWATWRDRWAEYVLAPDDADAVIARTWTRWAARFYWRTIFRQLREGRFDSWDYPWILTVWRHRALCARPTVNLVENIGFGADATHTTSVNKALAGLPTYRGLAGFTRRVGPVAADRRRDRVDERAWLQLKPKTLVAMRFPWLTRLVHWLRRR